MIEVLSIVSFNDQNRVRYLEKSFRSFNKLYKNYRHIVIDGSVTIGTQFALYDEMHIEWHQENISYAQRLKSGIEKISSDYFVFLPDDYVWISQFPIEKAIEQCRNEKLDELKLSPRGMRWFSQENPIPRVWHNKNKLLVGDLVLPQNVNLQTKIINMIFRLFTSGEKLLQRGDLFISRRRWRRSFYEQFSLGSHIIRKNFILNILNNISALEKITSPGMLEKAIYKHLLIHKYSTGYYRFWTPAFHFIDVQVEGKKQDHKTKDMLIESNYQLYNKTCND